MKSEKNAPQILAPVNALSEVLPLLEAGAHWLYGGVLPGEWADRFPLTVPLNQRTFTSAQFPSMGELEQAVRKTVVKGGAFALTLNAPYYMDEQIPLVVDLARWAARVGVGALIVADPGLIATLRKGGLKLPLHLSTMGVAANARSAGLFARQGITRVILPRFLDLAQIRALTKANPSMEYEAFVLVGKCPHIEGLCTFIHDSADQRWPCEWPWEAEETDGGSPQPAVSGYLAAMRENDRRDGCGLCALPALRAAGVSTFKVVGRGAPLERKVRLVEQLSRVLKEMPPEPDEAWRSMCRDTYRDLYGRLCSVHNCYYPEVHAREEGPGGRHP